MSAALVSAVRWIAARWVALYTLGLPSDERAARRREIDSDVWEQGHELEESGRNRIAIAWDILGRLIRGVPGDILWRLSWRSAPRPEIRGPVTFHDVMEAGEGEFYALLSKERAIREAPGPKVLLYVLEHPNSTVSDIAARAGVTDLDEAKVNDMLEHLVQEGLIVVRREAGQTGVEASPYLFPKQDRPYSMDDVIREFFASYNRHRRAEQGRIREEKYRHAVILVYLRRYPSSAVVDLAQAFKRPESELLKYLEDLEGEGLVCREGHDPARYVVNPRRFFGPHEHYTFQQALEDVFALAWNA